MIVKRLLARLPSSSTMTLASFTRSFSTPLPPNLQVFDRDVKRRQRDWAVCQNDFEAAQYLKEEIGWRIADKVFDLTKFNERVLDIGCGSGHIAPHLIKENVRHIVQCDMSRKMVEKSKGCDDEEVTVERVVCDEETLDQFESNSFDLLLTSLSAHWINNLPGWFSRCHEILKEDCPFIGAMLAQDTLYELRCSLQLAELERLGGVGSHLSPFVQAQDIGSLLGKAGFDMVTLDSDEVQIGYPNTFALLYDLQLMAETNCTYKRHPNVRRDVLIAAEAIYKAMYANGDKYPASFKIVSWIGWKQGPLTPKPAKRGSQTVSFKDISTLVENPDLQEKLQKKEYDDKEKK